ncbi:TetR/AcrR family transcriptional regulator [Spongisporangium articulatum]|uniref:TetR/AcrR family transcriptional regulator n=1 Tax=Spongisporangium articulatum TaxID=3362603 RepID=A0ABW8ANP0_9ACTN
MATDDVPAAPAPGRRGRRPNSPEDEQRVRDSIVEALTDAFAEVGYHGLTVALVLERAQVSRGTFYKYFRDLDEPMALMLERVTRSIVDLVTPALVGPGGFTRRTEEAVDGYLEWGRRHRAVLPSLFADLHDPSSPVATNRDLWLGRLVDLLGLQFEQAGGRRPDPQVLYVLLNTLEFSCYHHHLTHAEDDTEALAATRATMLRVAVALLLPTDRWLPAVERMSLSEN